MQNNDFRAKQFLMFDALEGFSYGIHKIGVTIKNTKLEVGKFVTISYYNDLDYIITSGKIKSIDNKNRYLYILNTKIYLDNIVRIE